MKNKSFLQPKDHDEENQEQPGLSGRLRSFKESLYMGVILTLEAEANAYVFPFVLNFLMWLQIILLPFSQILGRVWGTGVFPNALRTALNVLEIRPLLQAAGFIYFTIGLYMFVGLIAVGCLTLYMSSNLHFFRKIRPDSFLQANKMLIILLTKIMMFPIFSMLISNFRCEQNLEGIYTLVGFKDVACFSGAQLVNLVFAIIFIIIYLFYGYVVNMLYYETNAERRLVQGSLPSSSRVILFFFLAKFAVINILPSASEQEYLALVLLLVGNGLLFKEFYTYSPFFDNGIKKLTKVMVAVSLWTVLVGFFAKTLSKVTYDDPLVLWVLGIPLIIAIVLLSPEKNLGLLLTDLSQISDCGTICRQQSYIMSLWQNRDYNKYNGVVLDGFITIHQQSCDLMDCPIRKAGVTGTATKFKIENYDVILAFIEFNFQTAIARYPANVELRVHYVLFLEKWMARFPDILAQLNVLDSLKTNFYHDFFVFKYKLKTTGRLKSFTKNAAFTANKERGEGGKEARIMADFIRKMEASCMAYMRFWNHLAEDIPDHYQLKNLGLEIHKTCTAIETVWNNLQAVPLYERIKLMMLYGNFQKHVMNKATGGDQILSKARELLAIQKAEMQGEQVIDLDLGLTDLPNASILVSGNLDNIGEILKANNSATILFGYGPKELNGFNVKTLIPNTFNMHHDAYLERATTSKSLEHIGKDRLLFGLSKQGYLVPIYISIKPISSPFMCFIAGMKPIRQMHMTGFALTDYKGRIEAVSPGMINLFQIDTKAITVQPLLSHYLPGLFEEREYYLERGEGILPTKYGLNRIHQSSSENNFSSKILIDVSKHQHWLMIKEYYIFKFTMVEERDMGRSMRREKNQNTISDPDNNGFEFWIDDNTFTVFGRHYKPPSNNTVIEEEEFEFSEVVGKEQKKNQQTKKMMKLSRRPRLISHKENSSDLIDWAGDVKTFKLDNGKIIELENVTDENEERQAVNQNTKNEEDQLSKKKESDEESLSIIQNIKSNRLMKQFMTKKRLPWLILITFILANLLFVSCIIATSYEYNGNSSIIDRSLIYHNLFTHYSLQLYEFQNIADAIIQLVGWPIKPTNQTMSESDLKNYLTFTVMAVEELNDLIMADMLRLDDQIIYNNTIYSNITMYNLNKVFYPTEYTKSIKQLLAQSIIVKDMNLTSIKFREQTAVYFSVVNILNDGWSVLYDKTLMILNVCNAMIREQGAFKIDQFIGVFSLVALAIVFWIMIMLMNRHATKNINLFLDIAHSEVKRYISNCEFFITNIHTNSLDQANFDDLAGFRESEEGENLAIRRGRRDASKKLQVPVSFYLQFLLTLFVSIGLSIWLFMDHSSSMENFIQLSSEASNVATLGSYYHMVSNVMLLKTIDVQAKVNPPFNFTLDDVFLAKAFRRDSEFYNGQLENTRFHSQEYQSTINMIMNDDFCKLMIENQTFSGGFYDLGDPALCSNKTEKLGLNLFLRQGFRSGFSFYQDSLYEIFIEYQKYRDGTKNLDMIKPFANPRCKVPADYEKSCAFGFSNIEKNYYYQNIYLNYITKFMLNLFKDDLRDYIVASIKSKEAGIFSFFILTMVIAYFAVYLKTFLDVRRDYYLVQRMVLMVPLESIKYSLYIKGFFKDHLERLLK